MLVGDVYDLVCETCLEPGGFQLGLVTEAQFLQFYRAVMEDFLGRTRLAKAVALDAQLYSESEYTVPDWLEDIEAVFSDGVALGLDNEGSISSRDRNWQNRIDTPRSWRQDKLNMQTVALYPAPVASNSQVPPPGPPDFGVISTDVPGSASAVQANVGTLVQAAQVGTFTTPGGFFGATSLTQFSRGNVAMIGVLGLFTEDVTLTSPVESITDDFAIFLRYGILAKIFAADSENRDVLRERYCRARYEEGISLGAAVMGEYVDSQ